MERRVWFFPCVVAACLAVQPPSARADDPTANSAEAAKAGYAAAAALQNRGEWDLAAEEWESLVKRFPRDPLAGKGWYYLGICRLKQERFGDAVAAFDAAIGAKPDVDTLALAEFERGRGLYADARAGRKEAYPKAAEALGRFAASRPNHPKAADARELEAEALWQEGRRAEAVERWKTLTGDDAEASRRPNALYALGVGLAELGRNDEALAAFDRFAKRFSEHPLSRDVTVWRSDLLLRASRPAEAEKLLVSLPGKAADRAPEVLERLARARYLQKKPLDAASTYAELAATFPDAPAAKGAGMAAAIAYREGKDASRAKEWFAKVASAGGPRADEAAHELAVLELEAGDPKAALAVSDRAIARKPSEKMVPALLLDRADALWQLPDRRGEAADAYAKLADGYPAAATAATATALSAMAELGRDRPDAAIKRVEAFLARFGPTTKEPASPELLADVRRIGAEALLASAAGRSKSDDAAGAAAILERLVKEFPDSRRIDVAWYRLGELREQAGRHDAAIEAFEACRKAKPDGDRAAMALLAIGWAHDAVGRPADATRVWTELIERFPSSASAAPAALARGDQRYRAGDLKGALSDVRSALAGTLTAEAACEARLLESLCLVGDGRTAEAIPLLVKLRGEMPSGFAEADRVLFELAMARLAEKDAAAAKDLAEFVKRFPKSQHAAEAWLELGELAWDERDWRRAGEAFTKAVESGPSPPVLEQASHRLGWSAVMRKDHAAAARAFERQIKAAPDGSLAADGWCMLGESLFKQEQFPKAAEAFAKALADPSKLSSDDFRSLALVRASDCAAKASRFDDSLKLARQLLDRGSDSSYAPQARYAAAWALQNLGRLDEALEQYRTLADASRSELGARARLMEGEVLFEKGQHAEAIKVFFKAAYGYGEKAAPREYHPWQAQATFEAARCFEAIGKVSQARKLYAELVDRYPDAQQAPAARKRLESLGES